MPRASKTAVEPKGKAIVLRPDRLIDLFWRRDAFKQERAVRKWDPLPQNCLERLRPGPGSDPQHLETHLSGPDAADISGAAAVFEELHRLDHRSLGIGTLSERDTGSLGKRRRPGQRSGACGTGRNTERKDEQEGFMMRHLLHLPGDARVAMNPP